MQIAPREKKKRWQTDAHQISRVGYDVESKNGQKLRRWSADVSITGGRKTRVIARLRPIAHQRQIVYCIRRMHAQRRLTAGRFRRPFTTVCTNDALRRLSVFK